MTKRDYIMLAECFRRTLTGAPMTFDMRLGAERAARDMAYQLAQLNPRFDQALFLENAAVEPRRTGSSP